MKLKAGKSGKREEKIEVEKVKRRKGEGKSKNKPVLTGKDGGGKRWISAAMFPKL